MTRAQDSALRQRVAELQRLLELQERFKDGLERAMAIERGEERESTRFGILLDSSYYRSKAGEYRRQILLLKRRLEDNNADQASGRG